jgi:hypothetical protein
VYERRWRKVPAGGRRGLASFRKRCRITVRAWGATAADAIIWLLIVLAGTLAWAPSVGLAAARETVDARYRQRMREETQRVLGGAVWSRHARRDPLPGAVRLIDRVNVGR